MIFEILPFFLVQEIFVYLLPGEIKELRLVSKKWNSLVTPIAVKSLNFAVEPENEGAIKNLYKRFGRHANVLNFESPHWLTVAIDEDFTKLVTTCCENVRSLKIVIGKNWEQHSELILALARTQRQFNHLSLTGLITQDFLIKISPALENLESAELGYFSKEAFKLFPLLDYITCPRLKIFTLRWQVSRNEKLLDKIRIKFPTLERINYIQCQGNSESVEYISINLKPLCVQSFKIRYKWQGFGIWLEFHPSGPLMNTKVAPSEDSNCSTFMMDQMNGIANFNYETEFSNFKALFPNIRKANIEIWTSSDTDFALLLTQLNEVEVLILDSWAEYQWLTFPDIKFCAKVLSISLKTSLPSNYLEWVATHFENLEQLHLDNVHKPWNPTKFHFKFLVKLYSEVPQSITFWECIISSSPKIKYIYLPENDPLFPEIKSRFTNVRVLVWHDMEQKIHRIHDSTGFNFNTKQVRGLINRS